MIDYFKTKRGNKAIAGAFSVLIIILLTFRAFIAINTYDEMFNLGEVYRVILGNTYLSENWDFFQMGDSFFYPFFKLFYLITGSTDGIVIFSRILFVVLRIIEAMFVYRVLQKFYGKTISYATVMIYYTAISFKLFYLWYDNYELLFQTIGLLLLFEYYQSDSDDKIKNRVILFAAGAFNAMMVYSYPLTIIAVVYIAAVMIIKKGKKNKIKDLIMFFSGIFVVLLIFIFYVLKIGINNLFLFQKSGLSSALETSGRGNMFEIKVLMEKAIEFISVNFDLYYIDFIFIIVSFLIAIYVKKKKRGALILLLTLSAGCYKLVYWKSFFSNNSVNVMLTYLSFFAPMLYFIFEKEYRQKFKNLMLFIYIPSYLCGFAYVFTALYGSIKFSAGARCAGIVTLILLFDFVLNYCDIKFSKQCIGIFMVMIVGLNMVNVYISSFFGTDPVHCNSVFSDGIYKGIIDSGENVEKYTDFQKRLDSIIDDKDTTITFGEDTVFGYLMTDLKPNTNYIGNPGSVSTNEKGEKEADPQDLEAYYNKYYGYADIFVLRDDGVEFKSESFMDFINKNYKLCDQSDGYLFYKLNR